VICQSPAIRDESNEPLQIGGTEPVTARSAEGTVLARLLPSPADNRFAGQRLGLWLFALMPVKIPMGLNVMANTARVAESADGVPVQSLGAAGAQAFLFMFSAWGLCQVVLGVLALVVLLRYRSLVALAFLLLLVEQAGRMVLRQSWPMERVGTSAGLYINAALLSIMTVGLVLSVWPSRAQPVGG
jgi:hypothetical protein